VSYRVIPTLRFQKDVKHLQKKYRHIIPDLEELNNILADNPSCGNAIEGLEGKVFKIRLASSDTAKGKSGGFRIIYYLLHTDKTVYLLTIYAKAYRENIDPAEIKVILKKPGCGSYYIRQRFSFIWIFNAAIQNIAKHPPYMENV